jgi:hypothetical protein
MVPGMTMVGDMFNNALKSKLDLICTELAAYVAQTQSGAFGRDRQTVEASKPIGELVASSSWETKFSWRTK